MIKLFSSTDRLYSSNGDKIIMPLKAKIYKEDNGAFYLDLEASLDYVDDLVERALLVAPTPHGEQAFRVTNPQKTRKKISTKAYHVFYDSKNYLIEDGNVVDKNCNDALAILSNAVSDNSPFTTSSDIQTIASYHCIKYSLYEAIQTILERWGGHLVRDNFKIQIMSTIGQDNGVTIKYAKNLRDITCEEKWDNVVTKLLPIGKDGILLNALDENADAYVYSSTQYELPYTKKESFSQDDISEDDYKNDNGELDQIAYKQALIADLKIQAQKYVELNCKPKVNYTLKAHLDKITDIGDTIEVIDERLGINIFTNVIAYTYDCILKKYTEVEFGNFKQKLSNLISNITSATTEKVEKSNTETQIIMSNEFKDATDKILGVLENSNIIYEGDKILILDRLPKENAKYVIMINNAGIGFSHTGINGIFKNAWTIDGTLNMEAVEITNFTADLIRGGILKLGSNVNEYGQLELFDESNNLIAELNKKGLKMYGVDQSYILINKQVGFAGYDRLGNKLYWCDHEKFHIKKSVVEEEIIFCNKLKFVPITLIDSNNNITSDGIGIVPTIGEVGTLNG